MLQVHSLSFDYAEKPLLHGIEFSLIPGQLLHLQGKNGAGKTSLLKLLAGILLPIEGKICWDGSEIDHDLPTYQRQLCYVGHKMGLSPQLTVKENCHFDWHWGRKKLSFEELLQGFDLTGLEDKPCHQLSQGQRRRVTLLRIALTDAPLWLLDEPLAALDSSSVVSLINCINVHLQSGGIIVMTSHQALPRIIDDYQVYVL